ncbi:MAG: TIGR01440 family protein, partial [Oscillospiraceae bacterium]
TLKNEAYNVAKELISVAKLTQGQILVVGCSTSEVGGEKIGTASIPSLGQALFEGIYNAANEKGVFVAAQCCEHLNRAIVLPKAAATGIEVVNAVPQPKAGGSFATAAYKTLENPVTVEEIKADAGLDIGGTLIGMHLKKVAVPVRLSTNKIGCANIIAARTRAKYIGGCRTVYDDEIG